MHVNDIIWIVIEDSEERTELVTNVLAKCKSVTSVHLFARSSEPPSVVNDHIKRAVQRNVGLSWMRTYCSIDRVNCNGVVYFMDDNNKYSLMLFHEVSKGYRYS